MPGSLPRPHADVTALGVMWGHESTLTDADDAFLAIIGYSRADLDAGLIDWRELTPPEYLHLDEAGMRQAAKSGGFTSPYQKEFIRKDRSRVGVMLVCAFIPDSPGDWMGYVVDLTGAQKDGPPPVDWTDVAPIMPVPDEFYRRLVGELVKTRTNMVAMLDSSDSPIWALDRRFMLLGANAAFQTIQRRVSGRDLDIGETVLSHDFPEENLREWEALYQRALAGERVTHFTEQSADGAMYRYDHVLTPMRDLSGSIYGVTVVAHDVSERYAAEDALRASELRFRTLASSSPLGIYLCDVKGDVVYANERMQQIFQLSAHELLGLGSTTRLHPEDRERVQQEWRAAVRESRDVFLEFRLLLPNDNVRHVRTWISRLHADGGTDGFVGSVEDATESYEMAQRTRQRERLESLGTLAGGIAHDFNNMLGIVLGYTELGLIEPGLPEPLTKDLEEIRTASLRARDLVRQILAFSRHAEGAFVPVNLTELAQESGRLLRATLPAQIAFAVRVPAIPITVLGDASALQQVIVNLCINAEHALRKAHAPAITVELHVDQDDAAPIVRLVVRDNGMGMPAAVAGRIFEPFFTTKRVGEGTGMGLAVVHGTVLAHHGSITVDTTVGVGTSFVITLPTISTLPQVATPIPPSRTSAGHVLLIEDEPQLATIFSRTLRRAGFTVTICVNADEALRALANAPRLPDVVLSDVAMPGMTGDRLASALAVSHPDLPVVLMTGFSSTVTPETPPSSNVVAVLQKPISSSVLTEALARATQG